MNSAEILSLDEAIYRVGGLPLDSSSEKLRSFSGREYLNSLIEVKRIIQENPSQAKKLMGETTLGPFNYRESGRVEWSRPSIPNDPFPEEDFSNRHYINLRFIEQLEEASKSAISEIVTYGTLRGVVNRDRDNNPRLGTGPIYWLNGENFFVPNEIRSRGRNHPYIFLDS